MTFPRVVKDLLMFAPSLRRWPVAPVELARSDPARSTKLCAKIDCVGIEVSCGGQTQNIIMKREDK